MWILKALVSVCCLVEIVANIDVAHADGSRPQG
jgi:hypothetical protein